MASRFASVGLSVALASALALVARDADAFCRSTTCRGESCEKDDDGCPVSGAKLFWPTSCLQFNVNKRGTGQLDPIETRLAIEKAFSAWSSLACPDGGRASMTLTRGDDVPCKRSEYDEAGPNLNVVLFQDERWIYRGVDNTLAKTSVTYSDSTGEIFDADIEVNSAINVVTTTDDPRQVEQDLESVLTHEVGHFLGIAHSPLDDAVMFPSYGAGELKRELSDDDKRALCAVYPPDSGVACRQDPKGGFRAECPEAPEESGGLCALSPRAPAAAAAVPGVLVALAAAALGRRRRASSGARAHAAPSSLPSSRSAPAAPPAPLD